MRRVPQVGKIINIMPSLVSQTTFYWYPDKMGLGPLLHMRGNETETEMKVEKHVRFRSF